MKTRTLSNKDFTKHGLKKVINREVSELNAVSDRDLLSVWSFFKFLITQNDDKEIIFVTPDNSISAKYGAVLSKNTGIKIMLMSELVDDKDA
jgi:hypothetical protein